MPFSSLTFSTRSIEHSVIQAALFRNLSTWLPAGLHKKIQFKLHCAAPLPLIRFHNMYDNLDLVMCW